MIYDKDDIFCKNCDGDVLNVLMPFQNCDHCNNMHCNSCIISFPHQFDTQLHICLSCINKIKRI